MNIIRSFQLEWLKLKHYRIFWVLYGMYMIALVVIASFGAFFLEWLKSKGADFSHLRGLKNLRELDMSGLQNLDDNDMAMAKAAGMAAVMGGTSPGDDERPQR